MKLTDLEPRWWSFEPGGPRVGLTFLCPHCKTERVGVVFHHRGHEAIEDQYIKAHSPGTDSDHIWTVEGDDFHNLTITPSIDASKIVHWHGYVTNGEIK
jgi:Family of unknown function (DUF6527)